MIWLTKDCYKADWCPVYLRPTHHKWFHQGLACNLHCLIKCILQGVYQMSSSKVHDFSRFSLTISIKFPGCSFLRRMTFWAMLFSRAVATPDRRASFRTTVPLSLVTFPDLANLFDSFPNKFLTFPGDLKFPENCRLARLVDTLISISFLPHICVKQK